MPYLQSAWADLIKSAGGCTQWNNNQQQVFTTTTNGSSKREDASSTSSVAPKQGVGASDGKTLRTIPHDYQNKGASQNTNNQTQSGTATSSCNQMTKLQCVYNIVHSQIDDLYNNRPAESTEDESFFHYSIQIDSVMFCGKYSNIYLSHHNDHPEYHLIGRVFETSAKIDPNRSIYLKILKHIGKYEPFGYHGHKDIKFHQSLLFTLLYFYYQQQPNKGKRHHSVIGTWDIFYDSNGRVVIFQEFAQYGNLQEYLRLNHIYIPEIIIQDWAVQIYRGLDFLGDAGICHRSINPKHILLSPAANDPNKFLCKLGSFRDAMIYFDTKNGRIRNQPCRPLEKRHLANYQAPEVFGDPSSEEYDPIIADVWSYGATFFFAGTR